MKYSPRLVESIQKVQDFHFPKAEHLIYDNFVVGFVQRSGGSQGMNVIMKNGQKSDLPLNSSKGNWTEVRIEPANAITRKVVVCFDVATSRLSGIQFFDKDGTIILEAGRIDYQK